MEGNVNNCVKDGWSVKKTVDHIKLNWLTVDVITRSVLSFRQLNISNRFLPPIIIHPRHTRTTLFTINWVCFVWEFWYIMICKFLKFCFHLYIRTMFSVLTACKLFCYIVTTICCLNAPNSQMQLRVRYNHWTITNKHKSYVGLRLSVPLYAFLNQPIIST